MIRKEFIIRPTRVDLPYSQAVRAGDYIFVSGTLGNINAKGNPIQGIEAQSIQCLENINQVLQTAGASLSDVVKTTVFLTDINNFTKMNEVYMKYFPEARPTRSTVITGLVRSDALIEIECIAYKP
jgi:2-iminobutanoate/2-iminopropanoate deaminase